MCLYFWKWFWSLLKYWYHWSPAQFWWNSLSATPPCFLQSRCLLKCLESGAWSGELCGNAWTRLYSARISTPRAARREEKITHLSENRGKREGKKDWSGLKMDHLKPSKLTEPSLVKARPTGQRLTTSLSLNSISSEVSFLLSGVFLNNMSQ